MSWLRSNRFKIGDKVYWVEQEAKNKEYTEVLIRVCSGTIMAYEKTKCSVQQITGQLKTIETSFLYKDTFKLKESVQILMSNDENFLHETCCMTF